MKKLDSDIFDNIIYYLKLRGLDKIHGHDGISPIYVENSDIDNFEYFIRVSDDKIYLDSDYLDPTDELMTEAVDMNFTNFNEFFANMYKAEITLFEKAIKVGFEPDYKRVRKY